MIKINLAKRKMASVAGVDGGSGGGLQGLDRIRAMFDRGGGGAANAGASKWPLVSIAICLAGVYGSEFYFNDEKQKLLSSLDKRIEAQKKKQAELQGKLAQDAKLQGQKEELTANEKLVKTKLDTISQLLSNRQATVQALKELSTTIPPEVWLQVVSFGQTDVELSGQSLDYNQISDFMNRLGQSQFLADLNLESSSQAKDDAGLNATSFRLTAKRK
ncbi:hypothetical protein EBZ37_04660 [bacterium]|nr:hypothetical protein [bacterium]